MGSLFHDFSILGHQAQLGHRLVGVVNGVICGFIGPLTVWSSEFIVGLPMVGAVGLHCVGL